MIPWSGRFPGEENGNSLQYSCWDNPKTEGAWWVTVSVGMLVAQLCPTLCDPMDCSPPGSSVYEISQAIILEWVAIPFSRDLPYAGIEPKSPVLQADSLPSEPPWKRE